MSTEGDASQIWAGSSASQIRDRFDAFPGISQKKAAMAVMVLWRNRGVQIRDMHECDVAVDIHLRRVFLRTGLAERDEPREMIQAARDVHPQLPAALDPPAWTVGRHWCRPKAPDCPNCPLTRVCLKLIDRAGGVTGP
jgi:endonuclease III